MQDQESGTAKHSSCVCVWMWLTYCATLVKLHLGAILFKNLLEIRFNHQTAHDYFIQYVVDFVHVEDYVQLADGLKASVHCFDKNLK